MGELLDAKLLFKRGLKDGGNIEVGNISGIIQPCGQRHISADCFVLNRAAVSGKVYID